MKFCKKKYIVKVNLTFSLILLEKIIVLVLILYNSDISHKNNVSFRKKQKVTLNIEIVTQKKRNNCNEKKLKRNGKKNIFFY